MQVAINANLAHLNGNKNEQLQQVSRQFEALFWQQALKAMRSANASLSGEQSSSMQMYTEMQDAKLSEVLAAQNSLGFGKLIARQTKLNQEDEQGAKNINAIISHPKDQTKAQITNSAQETAPKAANLPNQQQAFVANLIPHAAKSAQKLGVNPAFLVAQAALETNWGKQVSGNNLFGIKAHNWRGAKNTSATFEVRDGKWQRENADFRSYHNWQQACDDYVNFLQNNPRYKRALQVAASKANNNNEQFVAELQKAGYATDPNYARKIKQIARLINLIQQN